MSFSPEERQRYARQLTLSGFGGRAQEALRRGRIFVVGCGGLGSPALAYLAAAGVGTLGFADGDRVDVSNLQRQILHATPDIGRAKAESAESHLRALNPHISLHPLRQSLTEENADETLAPYDFVVDATDSFASKSLLAQTCARLRKPYVFGALDAFSGQLLTVIPGATACLRCIFPEPPAQVPPTGPLGGIPGVIGSLQAIEAIKFLTGLGDLHTDALLVYDGLAGTFRSVQARRNPNCPYCSTAVTATEPRTAHHPSKGEAPHA